MVAEAVVLGNAGGARDSFGKALVALMADFPNLVMVDAGADAESTERFRGEFPERYLTFSNGQQNAIAAAGGLASVGLMPVVTSNAALCLRAVEQARQSLAFGARNVKIVASHGGIGGGPDGAPVQALEDLAAFRSIPGMTVLSPADSAEMALALRAMLAFDGPVYLRTHSGTSTRTYDENSKFEIGTGEIVRNGTDVTIIACGVEVARAIEAATLLEEEEIDARVVNMATIKPIDAKLLARCADATGAIVTAEDHNVLGGLGGAVAEALAKTVPCPIEFVGVQDSFGTCGEPDELVERFALGAVHIAAAARRAIARKKPR